MFSKWVLARKAKNQYIWKGFEAIPKALKELKDEGLKENFSSFDGNDDSKVSDDEEDDERISDTRTESQPDKLNPSLNLKSSASSKPDCENPKCGKRCIPTPRAGTYVQLDDGTELLDAVMFGDVAENIFSCTAIQLRSYSDEKHKLFVQKTTKQLSAKKWRIQLYVDANRIMTSKYNQFTIQAVEPMED
ncbi:hypothetical protein CsatB_024674 [Cannabis sativa]|uniref:uncharacterized protein LOC133037806 n=1 Tax=Cannabis sativa TaxID=3483 RepID=UPI0029CA0CA2|nr:uncharacterized protein LOC133037806 [Cannabis sativa]